MAFGLTQPARAAFFAHGFGREVNVGILNRYHELAPRLIANHVRREFLTNQDGVTLLIFRYSTPDADYLTQFWLEVRPTDSEYVCTFVKMVCVPH